MIDDDDDDECHDGDTDDEIKEPRSKMKKVIVECKLKCTTPLSQQAHK